MFKSRTMVWKGLALLAALSLWLTGCGRPATPTPVAQGTAASSTEAAQPTAVADATSPTQESSAAPGDQSGEFDFACPGPDPKMPVTSKELSLLVRAGSVPKILISCFELVYGVKVRLDQYASNEEMVATFSAGSPDYDLVQPMDYLVSLMIRQDRLQKLDKGKLTHWSNLDPQFLNLPFDPNNEYSLPYLAGTYAIVYNADKVATPPASFADLWNPDNAGEPVVLPDDSRAVIGAALLALGYDVNTTDSKQLDEARVKLGNLVPGVKLFDNYAKTALVAGDVDLGITSSGEAVLAANENPAIQYAYPQEGAIVWQDNYAIPKTAQHLDAAYAWLNYSLQSDVFWLMVTDSAYTNPNKAALDDAEANHPEYYNAYVNSPITNPPPDVLKAGHRIEDVGDALPLYDKLWAEVTGK